MMSSTSSGACRVLIFLSALLASCLCQQLLGWQLRTTLEDGLRRTIEYFDDLLSSAASP